MEIVQSILTDNPCYKTGHKIEVHGLMLHSVGCNQPSAEVFVKEWNKHTEQKKCVHAFIDGVTGKVYQTLPWEHKGWHCGGAGNSTYIGVEMCEPSGIRYNGGAAFNCLDRSEALAVVKRTYNAAVELFALLCQQYHLDPLKDGVIISHKEGHARGIASAHEDPSHLWNGLESGYTMDGFRHDVALAMHRAERTVQANDVVRIAPNAAYYTGKEAPDWVKSDEWIVKSVEGERVVLGGNVRGTNQINSPFHSKDLIVVSHWELENPESEDPKRPRMDISEEGVRLIMRFEGCRLSAYQCAAGVWTIGYGHTRGVKPGDELPSQEAARDLLYEDLKEYTGYVNTYIERKVIGFPVNQNQFDALTSFCYNRGSGRLRELVTDRDAPAAAEAMLSFIVVNGEINEGLRRRREAERELFLR